MSHMGHNSKVPIRIHERYLQILLKFTKCRPSCEGRGKWITDYGIPSVRTDPESYLRMSHISHEWVRSRNESYEWVMSPMNESWLPWMSHVSHEWVMFCINESCQGMSRMNESCLPWMSCVLRADTRQLQCSTVENAVHGRECYIVPVKDICIQGMVERKTHGREWDKKRKTHT